MDYNVLVGRTRTMFQGFSVEISIESFIYIGAIITHTKSSWTRADYYEVKHSDRVQDVLKTFLQYKTILFIGYGSGLEDPNFDALLR